MVVASYFRIIQELDPSKAVDVIIESELNQRVFKALVQLYQNERSYQPPKIEMSKYPEGLSEEDKMDLAFGRHVRTAFEHPEHLVPIEWPYKTIEEMGNLAGEHDLKALEKSLESFHSVVLVTILHDRNNIYYHNPDRFNHPYRLKNSGEKIDFYGYLDRIRDRIDLISQAAKSLKK
jgi:hypothetical protein